MKNRYVIFPLLTAGLLLLAGCGETVSVNKPVDSGTKVVSKEVALKTDSKEEAKKLEAKIDSSLPSFFQTSEIEYIKPIALNTEAVLAPYKVAMLKASDDYNKSFDPNAKPTDWAEIANAYKFHEVGTIKKAPYEGMKLINLVLDCDGPCDSANIHRFAYDSVKGKLVKLENYSNPDSWGQDDFAVISKTSDDEFTIQGMKLPNSIMLPDGINSAELDVADVDMATNENLLNNKKDTPGSTSPYAWIDLGKVAFTDPKLGDVYFSGSEGSGCLFLKSPDGTVSKYAYNPKMFGDTYYQSIKWNDKQETSNLSSNYSLAARGCGIIGNCYFVEDVAEADLKVVGKSSAGVVLYMVKDPVETSKAVNNAQKAFAQAFDTYTSVWQYMDESTRKPKMTFEQFVAFRPQLYWKDPFSRFVQVINNEVKEPAECGKPVIYLYPEKTTDVSVKVGIDKFTKTVPEYGNDGWVVKAEPNGKLLNYADGKNYPYLFWEGTSKKGISTEGGFVVARADLSVFLENSLTKLGLNEQERSDFSDFWLAKMKASNQPYFLINFVGTGEFNKVAPLEISPHPETLIRVFMYYQPLVSPIKVKAQQLKAIPRRGFTVVEWGGTSSDSWQVQ